LHHLTDPSHLRPADGWAVAPREERKPHMTQSIWRSLAAGQCHSGITAQVTTYWCLCVFCSCNQTLLQSFHPWWQSPSIIQPNSHSPLGQSVDVLTPL
jgi:hypothetical protein